MRRMYSEKQLQKFIEEYGLTEEQVETMLVGKYVRIMDAPTSTTLTDVQIAQILEGTFINGEFISVKNPVLFPPTETSTTYVGMMLGGYLFDQVILSLYSINKTSKVISKLDTGTYFNAINGKLNAEISQLNGKILPANPSNTGTFVLKCVDGTLTWVEEV